MVSIDDFKKIEMMIGQIKSAERVPDTDKLVKLTVDFGLKQSVNNTDCSSDQDGLGLKPSAKSADGSSDHSEEQNDVGEVRDIRQVVSGIAPYFEDAETLVGIKCPFVTNLEPRKICGLESQAMILAALSDGTFSVLEATMGDIPVGTTLS